jgi:hypothetical protein
LSKILEKRNHVETTKINGGNSIQIEWEGVDWTDLARVRDQW